MWTMLPSPAYQYFVLDKEQMMVSFFARGEQGTMTSGGYSKPVMGTRSFCRKSTTHPSFHSAKDSFTSSFTYLIYY